MQPHEERVIVEKRELDEKLAKLKAFRESNATFKKLHPVDRDLLEDQYMVMEQYSRILAKRIERFYPEK